MRTTAIVTAGAGARGAYEAGLLSVLVPRLVLETDGEERVVLLGTSAGAINTALLAAFRDPEEGIQNMLQVWESTDASDVFAGLPRTAIRDVASYSAEVLGRGQLNSLLDSAPLRRTMEKQPIWGQLRDNLDSGKGWAHGAGIVTTSFSSGRSIIFLQGKGIVPPPADDIRGIDYVPVALTARHILASAAIPVAFLPIQIGQPSTIDGWFVDGGVRQNAPIAPALAIGADRVIIVATTPDPDLPQSLPAGPAEPAVFDVAGVVLRALLIDRMAEDVRTLRKTNHFVESAAKANAPPPAHRDGGQTYRRVQHLFLGPPKVGILSTTAYEVFTRRYRRRLKQLSRAGILGTLISGSSTDPHGEILSFLFFDPDYHSALIRLGKQHAEEALASDRRLPWRV